MLNYSICNVEILYNFSLKTESHNVDIRTIAWTFVYLCMFAYTYTDREIDTHTNSNDHDVIKSLEKILRRKYLLEDEQDWEGYQK